MKWDTREPCGSCPYRKDAPLGLWHPSEFDRLVATDQSQVGSLFGCHATIKKEHPSVCAGWLLDQRERGIPSLMLRVALMRERKEAGGCLEQVSSGGHPLYKSIAAMVAANESLGRCGRCGSYLQPDGACGVCT